MLSLDKVCKGFLQMTIAAVILLSTRPALGQINPNPTINPPASYPIQSPFGTYQPGFATPGSNLTPLPFSEYPYPTLGGNVYPVTPYQDPYSMTVSPDPYALPYPYPYPYPYANPAAIPTNPNAPPVVQGPIVPSPNVSTPLVPNLNIVPNGPMSPGYPYPYVYGSGNVMPYQFPGVQVIP